MDIYIALITQAGDLNDHHDLHWYSASTTCPRLQRLFQPNDGLRKDASPMQGEPKCLPHFLHKFSVAKPHHSGILNPSVGRHASVLTGGASTHWNTQFTLTQSLETEGNRGGFTRNSPTAESKTP